MDTKFSADLLNSEKSRFHGTSNYQDTVKYYDDWSDTYDLDLEKKNRRAPEHFANFIEKDITDKNAKMLDLGAGTGLVSRYLSQKGYKFVDGHDGSASMIEKAKEQKIYNSYFVEILEENERSKVMTHQFYDCVISLGCFCLNHLNQNHLQTIIDLAKPGGLIILGIREIDLSSDLAEEMKKLEERQKWKLVEKYICKEYQCTIEDKSQWLSGVFYVFSVTN